MSCMRAFFTATPFIGPLVSCYNVYAIWQEGKALKKEASLRLETLKKVEAQLKIFKSPEKRIRELCSHAVSTTNYVGEVEFYQRSRLHMIYGISGCLTTLVATVCLVSLSILPFQAGLAASLAISTFALALSRNLCLINPKLEAAKKGLLQSASFDEKNISDALTRLAPPPSPASSESSEEDPYSGDYENLCSSSEMSARDSRVPVAPPLKL